MHDLASIIHFFLSSAEPAEANAEDAIQGGVGNTFNTGGPDRLSRLGIAEAVAKHCGYSMDNIEAAESASIVRAAPSPLDISMDSSKLMDLVPFTLTPFADALAHLFPVPP